jgi:hypothetical protein
MRNLTKQAFRRLYIPFGDAIVDKWFPLRQAGLRPIRGMRTVGR